MPLKTCEVTNDNPQVKLGLKLIGNLERKFNMGVVLPEPCEKVDTYVPDSPSKSPYIVSQAMHAGDGAAMNIEYTGWSSLGNGSLVGNL